VLVRAAKDDEDRGEAFAQRLLTLVVVVLAAATVLLVVFAPALVDLYVHEATRDERELAVALSRFFLPQMLFYGAGAVMGAILNTRGRFGPPMWAPVLNNLVVIAAGVLFMVMTTAAPTPGGLTDGQTLVLALGTTGGIVLQTIALLPSLRRVGFRLRFRFDWRRAGFRSAGPFAAWMVGYVITNQIGYLVIVRLLTAAGRAQSAVGSGFSPYTYAFILFSLPYAVIAVTVVTALFPRMSRNAVDGDRAGVASTVGSGLNLSAVLLMPATTAMVALGPLIGTVVFNYEAIGLSGARLIGGALAGFAIGLVPFSAFQIQLRAFLALRDSRTPFVVNVVVTAVNVGADVALYLLLPGRAKVVGLALGFSLSYAVGTLVFGRILRRRLGPTEHAVGRTHIRLVVAATIAAIPMYAAARALTSGLGLGREAAFVAVVVGVLLGGATFLAIARRMRIAELEEIAGLVRSRLRPSA
jgi:putative peptidoglycan lipid II flippase